MFIRYILTRIVDFIDIPYYDMDETDVQLLFTLK